MSHRVAVASVLSLALALVVGVGCGSSEKAEPAAPAAQASKPAAAATGAAWKTPDDLPMGLLVALSKFEMGGGKPVPKSELMVLTRHGGAWHARSYTDPESNVFHKAMVYQAPDGPGIVTIGGTAAVVKLWRKGPNGLAPVQTLWKADFGGKTSRMRDVEAADLFGDGTSVLAVGTHDQGVVALVRPKPGGGYAVQELDRKPDTFIHEIEIGDLDGDGVLEVYATQSEPNRLNGKPQSGKVVRYIPKKGEGRKVVADFGNRHAKEILVGDVDGDGRDELYASIEAAEGGQVEIRRYDAGDPPTGGVTIATLPDPMARFLTAGDVDGDGKKEMVVSAKDSGVWLLRPGDDPRSLWNKELIDGNSKGFEHAALLADLDRDGRDELYVANDDQKQLCRYVWVDGKVHREVIYTRTDPLPVLTWNLMPVPVGLVE